MACHFSARPNDITIQIVQMYILRVKESKCGSTIMVGFGHEMLTCIFSQCFQIPLSGVVKHGICRKRVCDFCFQTKKST